MMQDLQKNTNESNEVINQLQSVNAQQRVQMSKINAEKNALDNSYNELLQMYQKVKTQIFLNQETIATLQNQLKQTLEQVASLQKSLNEANARLIEKSQPKANEPAIVQEDGC